MFTPLDFSLPFGLPSPPLGGYLRGLPALGGRKARGGGPGRTEKTFVFKGLDPGPPQAGGPPERRTRGLGDPGFSGGAGKDLVDRGSGLCTL